MVVILVLVFLLLPLAELYVIIAVGQAIGVWPTVAILAADSVLGALLLRHQGRTAWRQFTRALDERRVPGREVLNGVLVVFGGAFLITPGFITDVLGLLLLVPPTRAAIRGMLVTIGRRRFGLRVASGARRAGPYADRARERPAPYDVADDVHVYVEDDGPPLLKK